MSRSGGSARRTPESGRRWVVSVLPSVRGRQKIASLPLLSFVIAAGPGSLQAGAAQNVIRRRMLVYRLMNDHRDEVIAELNRISDVPRYLELRRKMREVNVAIDTDFQQLYRDYWRMSLSRLGTPFYTRYFAHMEELKTRDTSPDEAAIRDIAMLSDTPERSSLQFSFATKLLNTLDSREPVYDTHVTAFYFFVPPASDRHFETRLDALLEFYAFLRGEYARVIEEDLLGPAIRRFREQLGIDAALRDERIVDLLIWGFVSLMRRNVQQRGEVMYR